MKPFSAPRWNTRTAVSIGVLAIAALGCQRLRPGTGEAGSAPGTDADTSRSQIIRQATSLYDYGPERPPITVNASAFPGQHVPDGSIPRMTIATATLRRNVPRPTSRIIARIRSASAYAPMGIQAGDNYIWRSSRDTAAAGSWATRIVSSESGSKSYILRRDPSRTEYTHGDPFEPRLVRFILRSEALGACLDDPSCPTGHCGYF